MAHYIDADRLREELQKPKTELKVGNYYLDNSEQAVGYENALIDFELLIDSLQQEQPEVDLEKEIKFFLTGAIKMNKGQWRGEYHIGEIGIRAIAHRFYELGLNARKEDK